MSGQQFTFSLPERATNDLLRERLARLEQELSETDDPGVELAREIDRLRGLIGDARRRQP